MSEYVSDKEQIELIKNWWRENGRFTIVMIVLALALSFGWQYWQNNKNQRAAQASLLYEKLLDHQSKQQYSAVEEDVASLWAQYQGTPYASLAAFISAQNAVSLHKFAQAIGRLNFVIDHSSNRDFKQIARIRKARLLLAEKNPEQALKTLEVIEARTYLPEVYEVTGDIFMTRGDSDGARQAYLNALALLKKGAPNYPLLLMKSEQLGN